MPKEEPIEVQEEIVTTLPNAIFHVELENKHTVLAHITYRAK
jgi:translation initiation factor IF-1